jgi:hypothetical protein
MKKIVALVLCLVMALSLATVAFADSKTETIAIKGYDILNMASNTNLTPDVKEFTKTTKDPTKVTSGSTTTTTYFAVEYKFGSETYYECDKSIADYKLSKDGAVVAFLSKDSALEKGTSKVVSKIVEGKGKNAKSGEFKDDVYEIGGKYYEIGGSTMAMLNGKAVLYGAEATPVSHSWTKAESAEKGYVFYDKNGVATSVKDNDGTEYPVVETGKLPATYTGKTVPLTINGKGYIVMLGNAAAGGTATSAGGVQSAKTFDAGIAMYAGMALMSVAGGAVVIGKKKEF